MRDTIARDLPLALGLHASAAALRRLSASESLTPFTAASGTAAARSPVTNNLRAFLAPPMTFLIAANLRALFRNALCLFLRRPARLWNLLA